MNEKVNVEQLELAVSEPVSEVDFVLVLVELIGLRSLHHQDVVGHLYGHFVYLKPFIVRE